MASGSGVTIASVSVVQPTGTASASHGELIARAYTDQARYEPEDEVTISVDIDNQTGSAWSGTLYLDIAHLENVVYSDDQALSIGASQTTTETFLWESPSDDFRGYHVEVRADTTDQATTAIDVSSDWHRYPRYELTRGVRRSCPCDLRSVESEEQAESVVDCF